MVSRFLFRDSRPRARDVITPYANWFSILGGCEELLHPRKCHPLRPTAEKRRRYPTARGRDPKRSVSFSLAMLGVCRELTDPTILHDASTESSKAK